MVAYGAVAAGAPSGRRRRSRAPPAPTRRVLPLGRFPQRLGEHPLGEGVGLLASESLAVDVAHHAVQRRLHPRARADGTWG